MRKRCVAILLLAGTLALLPACSPAAADEVPQHPRAVLSQTACPPEAMSPGARCLLLKGVLVEEAIAWYREQLVQSGWTPPAHAPDDEPFPFLFTRRSQELRLIFARHKEGTSVLVRAIKQQ